MVIHQSKVKATLAARQTVHARAPRTMGGFELLFTGTGMNMDVDWEERGRRRGGGY
jgi:hypothetical protein